MEDVLKNLLYKHCLVYLDDICIMSNDFNGHLKSMDLVFDRLLKSGVNLKPKKCALIKKELKFLGHLLLGDGSRCDPEKTNVITNWKQPESTRDCR